MFYLSNSVCFSLHLFKWCFLCVRTLGRDPNKKKFKKSKSEINMASCWRYQTHLRAEPGASAQTCSFTADEAQRNRRTLGLNVPVLLFLIAPRIDFCNNRPGRPFHAPPAIHRSNTNNYTIITSPAAPTERREATASASGSAAQLALNLWHNVFSAPPWWVKTIKCHLQRRFSLIHLMCV